MAKSARASGIKKNKAALKKRVFGPVETARNERLSAKLLELAKQPKPPREEMEIEENGATSAEKAVGEDQPTTEGADDGMDLDAEGKPRLSKREIKRRQIERAARVEKKRKPRNRTTFAAHPKKKKGGRR